MIGGRLRRNVIADIDFITGPRGFFAHRQQVAGDFFVQIFFATIIANACGNTPDDQNLAISLQGYGHRAWLRFTIAADDAFHCFLLRTKCQALAPYWLRPRAGMSHTSSTRSPRVTM